MAKRKEGRPHGDGVLTLEEGDIYFVYRPKVEHGSAQGLEDVQRMNVVLHPRGEKRYRLLVIGEKKMPGVEKKGRKSWGFVERVSGDSGKLEEELSGKTYRTRTRGERDEPAVRPAGEGVYAIVRHGDHTHLAYALELPRKPGEVQEELNIEKEASYILSIKNPDKPSPSSTGLHEEQKAQFPKKLQERFRGRRFIAADPPDFLNYEGAELLLIGSTDDISEELDITLDTEKETEDTAEVFSDLHLRRSEHPVEPLFKGEWA